VARSVAGRPPGHPTRLSQVPETAAGVRAAVVHPFYAPLCVPVWMSVRVVEWRRWQRLKLAWQARLGPVCVACKFGHTVPPSRMYVAGAARPSVRGGELQGCVPQRV
jgi:hypothetical protein